MRIYVAGPYTKGDVAQNVRAAANVYDYLGRMGHTPFNPHLTHFQHMLFPQPYEFWLAQDMEWLKVCDAVFRLDGESSGADKEVAWAVEHGLPIYYSVFDVPRVE
jgi:hypothetical protein